MFCSCRAPWSLQTWSLSTETRTHWLQSSLVRPQTVIRWLWTLYSKPQNYHFDHRCAFVAVFEWQVRSFTHQKWSTAIWMVSTTQRAKSSNDSNKITLTATKSENTMQVQISDSIDNLCWDTCQSKSCQSRLTVMWKRNIFTGLDAVLCI